MIVLKSNNRQLTVYIKEYTLVNLNDNSTKDILAGNNEEVNHGKFSD